MPRLTDLKTKLEASLDGEGKPKKGYKGRVAALQRELVRLEPGTTARNTTPMNPVS